MAVVLLIIEKVWNDICRHGLFKAGDAVVLAVSGGADSMAMLHILCSLRDRLDLKLYVAHLNHMLRGGEAREDADFVRSAADSLGLPCRVGSADVPAVIAREKLSTEEAARKARYDFLHRTARELGASKIAVAHNADDQAETLLLHLLNGTGLEGLSGMRPLSGAVVRPLLGVRRREIEAFCSDLGIKFRTDSSNKDLTFSRNKVRHQLIPVLTEYNGNVVEVLTRTAEIIRAENDYIERETDIIFKDMVDFTGSGLQLCVEDFLDLDTALQRRLVRKVFQRLAGFEYSLEFGHVERVRDLFLSGQTGKRLDLPQGVMAEKTYSFVVFSTVKEDRNIDSGGGEWGPRSLNVPGITEIPAVSVRISAEVFPVEAVRGRVFSAPPEDAYLDLDKLELPLTVGPRKEGDTFQPLGCAGSKKIKKYLIDKKVPQSRRAQVPIVYDSRGIVWVAGFCIEDRAKVTDCTRQVLRLQLRQYRN
jgi:tRNA(Ile)-lysidine synthase